MVWLRSQQQAAVPTELDDNEPDEDADDDENVVEDSADEKADLGLDDSSAHQVPILSQ